MALTKIANFDDWIDLFKVWQTDIGLEAKELKDYKFDVKLAELDVPEIEFGHYNGQAKWKTVMHIPDQRIRDALPDADRLPGGHRVRVGGAAALAPAERAERLRPASRSTG